MPRSNAMSRAAAIALSRPAAVATTSWPSSASMSSRPSATMASSSTTRTRSRRTVEPPLAGIARSVGVRRQGRNRNLQRDDEPARPVGDVDLAVELIFQAALDRDGAETILLGHPDRRPAGLHPFQAQ